MNPGGPALVWCPFPDRDRAVQCAATLLDERLIACANIVPAMHSLFDWHGKRGEAEETGVLFKTDAALLDTAIARIEELHPYDDPAVIGWRCDAAARGTSAWLAGLTQ